MRLKIILLFLFTLTYLQESKSQSALYLEEGVELKVGSNATITVNGDLRTQNTTDTSALHNDGIIEVKGNFLNDGTGKFVGLNSGKIVFNGVALQQIHGKSAFYNLEIDNANGVQIVDSTELNNELVLTSGNLNTADKLTLNSTASKTARIAPILTGSISGDVTIEAFIENEAYDYRFLSMPVQSKTLDEWSDDILMTGFAGTPYPGFHFNSVYFYDETQSGDRNARYDSATNVTNSVNMGVGVQAYIGAADLLVDPTGEIYSGTLNFPVTFTDDVTQPVEEDGWNLLGNPYPSTIDWNSSDWVKVNLNDAIYIYKGSTNSYQTYINGVGTNGGTEFIPSSQAFWVKAIGAPTLTGNENVKSNEEVSFVERQKRKDILRLRLSNQTASDEIVVRYHEDATTKYDSDWDAYKLKGYPSNPIITAIQDSVEYAILTSNADSMSHEIYLQLEVPQSGMYTLNVDELPLNANCLVLEDLFTGNIKNLRDSASYQIYLSDTTSIARFKLTASTVVDLDLTKALCYGDLNHVSVVSKGAGTSDFSWNSSLGNQFSNTSFLTNTFSFVGNQEVTFIASKNGCSTQNKVIDLVVPDSILSLVTTTPDTGFSSGAAEVSVIGGTAPYTYDWSVKPGHQLEKIDSLSAGIYGLKVIDSNKCEVNEIVIINGISTGIENVKLNEVTVFPNPVKSRLNLLGLQNVTTFKLISIEGKIVKQGEVDLRESSLSVGDLSSGVYYLILNDGFEQKTIKINKI